MRMASGCVLRTALYVPDIGLIHLNGHLRGLCAGTDCALQTDDIHRNILFAIDDATDGAGGGPEPNSE